MSAVEPLAVSTTRPYQPREFGQLVKLAGLSREAVELHLGLYRGYVEQVNLLLAERDQDLRRFAFEYNGMILHELFFEALNPAPPGLLENGKFAKAVASCFGNVKSWKDDLRNLAGTRGVGWVVCACDRESNRLINVWVDLHHLGLPARATPVLVLDLWEHAWLTDFKPWQRRDYVECLFEQTDWQMVEKRCWTPRA